MFYRKSGNTFAIRLERGEEVVSKLKELCKAEGICAGYVTAIGAASHIEAGLYNLNTQQYNQNTFDGQYEITNITGNISTLNFNCYTHLHITFADEAGKCFGGHLNLAVISATCEMFVTTFDAYIGRAVDEVTGLNVFEF